MPAPSLPDLAPRRSARTGRPAPARVVAITGGTAGVGRACARTFAERGYDVAVLARGEEGLSATVGDVEQRGRRGLALDVDVADAAAVDEAAAAIEHELGPIDVWVNNAMTSVFARFVDISPDEFERVTDVTYLGTVYGTMAALRRMRARDRGVIVQVGSALAYRSIPLQSAYCGAKHAVVGFTDSIRSELVHDGSHVRITAVHLPAINTPQFRWVRNRLPKRAQPVPPIFQPEVAAEAIAWAAEHDRREVLLGATTWQAVWGQRLVPGWLDRYLAGAAWDEQMTGEDMIERPDNLFEPVHGDPGAHGPFDAVSRRRAPSFFLDRHRRALAATIGIGATLATIRLLTR